MRNPFDDDARLTEADLLAREQRQARVRKNADPQFLERLNRWAKRPLIRELEPLPMSIRPMATHFDNLARWYAGYLGVRGEYEAPDELRRDLRECVPQSLLRDIYRPVRREKLVEWVYTEISRDPAGQEALAEARAARERPPVERVQSSQILMTQVLRYRRRLHEQAWKPRRPDDAPRVYSEQQSSFFGDNDYFEADPE